MPESTSTCSGDARNQTGAELDYVAWYNREVQAGITSADAGDVLSFEEVEKHFAGRRAETLRNISDSR